MGLEECEVDGARNAKCKVFVAAHVEADKRCPALVVELIRTSDYVVVEVGGCIWEASKLVDVVLVKFIHGLGGRVARSYCVARKSKTVCQGPGAGPQIIRLQFGLNEDAY